MRFILPLFLLMGCVPLPTIPEHCAVIARAAADKTPGEEPIGYMLAWRQNYERAFEACK